MIHSVLIILNDPEVKVRTNMESARSASTAKRKSPLFRKLSYLGLFVTGILSFISHEWGGTIHSLIGVIILGFIIRHLSVHHNWIESAKQRRLKHPERALVIYNPILASVFLICILSGFPVWIWHLRGSFLAIHSASAIAFVPMFLVHLVLNRKRLRKIFR